MRSDIGFDGRDGMGKEKIGQNIGREMTILFAVAKMMSDFRYQCYIS
jgi:hypothetical protein